MEGLQPSDILIHIINILVLFFFLRIILFIPINRFLTDRSDRITGQMKEAAEKENEALALKQEYEQRIETTEEQGREIIRESQIKASGTADEIIKEARAQAEKIVSDAHVKATEDRAKVMESARGDVATLATEIAARILKREVTPGDNKTTAEDFFREKGPTE